MRYIHISTDGATMNIGVNKAKRRAKRLDKQDQAAVVKKIGPGLPRQRMHHQAVVKARRQLTESRRGQPDAT